MATAISKPTSHPPRMKRPPPPLVQTGVNGVKSQHTSASPQSSTQRLPGSNQPTSASSTGGPVANGLNGVPDANNGPNKGPLNKIKKDAQKSGDPATRLQKPSNRTLSTDIENRLGKKCPEPYVKTSSYILKKFAKSPPSLILHLHPTHFRFEQQDGSFPYNSEMKVVIEHIRAGTVPHDMMEELLRANVRFYEGCLIVRVVDHKSASAHTRKSTTTASNETNTPFSIHNYNEHVTPSAYVPYPKHNQLTSEKSSPVKGSPSQSDLKTNGESSSDGHHEERASKSSQKKEVPPKPRVFTTVLHPTPRSLQAELTLLATTPDPKAAQHSASNQAKTSSGPQSPGASSGQPERGHVAKRQKMLVEPQDLTSCESKLVRALAPPLFLEPLNSFDAVQDLLKYMESPLHRDPPPSPKRRKRTVAELAADEALAAEEERFMLIMDERLEPTTTAGAGATKTAAVDDTGGGAPFEPRFSRFKTLENIRMQHEDKARRAGEIQQKQEMIRKQQQDHQERERRRALEQRQAEEQAKEEARRQHMAAQQAQAQLAAQQQNRHVMPQPNGVSQGPQSSPVVRNQTPHNTSSPLVGNAMASQGVPMSMSSSMQGAGSPPRPQSALQHGHPNVMGHQMAPSRSQQGQSRHGTPQMAQGTPAVSHATPIMRNVTPTQRMSHASPQRQSMAPTPVMNHQSMMGTPQMPGGMVLTPQQQQQMLLHRQHMLAQQQQQQQQGHPGQAQLTPQQIAQLQAQQSIQSHQQQMLHAQQQNHQPQQSKMQQNPQTYQAQLMRAQLAQMQVAQQNQQHNQQQNQPHQQHHPQQPQQRPPQGQQPQMHQAGPQMSQQQQMLMAAAQANGGQLPQHLQGVNRQQNPMAQRYNTLYQQRLLKMRQEMATRLMPQYGPPTQYPPQISHQYQHGLEQHAKMWVQELARRERETMQQQRANQVAANMHAQVMQQNMMQNGMGK